MKPLHRINTTLNPILHCKGMDVVGWAELGKQCHRKNDNAVCNWLGTHVRASGFSHHGCMPTGAAYCECSTNIRENRVAYFVPISGAPGSSVLLCISCATNGCTRRRR